MAGAEAEPRTTTVRITLCDATTDKRTPKVSYVRQKSTITFEWLEGAAARQFQGRYAPGRVVRLYHGIEQEDGTVMAHRLDDNSDVQRMLDNPPRIILVSFMRPGNVQLLMSSPSVTDVRNIRQAPEEPREPKKSPAKPTETVQNRCSVIIEPVPMYKKQSILKHLELNKPPAGKRKAGEPEIKKNEEKNGDAVQEQCRKKKSPDAQQDKSESGKQSDITEIYENDPELPKK